MTEFRTARSAATEPVACADELAKALGRDSRAAVVFFSPERDGAALLTELRERLGHANIIGCSTAGELSTGQLSQGAVSIAAFGDDAKRAHVALADFEAGVEAGVEAAVASLEQQVGSPLRELSRDTHVVICLIDSVHGVEEEAHRVFGRHAPLMPIVGASAADGLKFERTVVAAGSETSSHGMAFMLLELARPFRVVRTNHFVRASDDMRVTSCEGRLLQELDGRPAVDVYCEHTGLKPEELTQESLFLHPIGLIIDDEAWIRQVMPPIRRDGSIQLGCEIAGGTAVCFLKPGAELIPHTAEFLESIKADLGGIRGALMFDCALRRLELDFAQSHSSYAELLDFPTAGFHTHGESLVGHMHQTLTALILG